MNDATDAASAAAVLTPLPSKAAKMAAVEILLADDVLEACLHIPRGRVREP